MKTPALGFAVLYLAGVSANMCASLQAPLVQQLAKTFGAEPRMIGLAMGAQFIAYLVAGTFVGRLVARLGVRNSVLTGLVLIIVTNFFNMLAPNLAWLAAGNLVQGLGMLTAVIAAQIGITMQAQGTGQARALATGPPRR